MDRRTAGPGAAHQGASARWRGRFGEDKCVVRLDQDAGGNCGVYSHDVCWCALLDAQQGWLPLWDCRGS